MQEQPYFTDFSPWMQPGCTAPAIILKDPDFGTVMTKTLPVELEPSDMYGQDLCTSYSLQCEGRYAIDDNSYVIKKIHNEAALPYLTIDGALIGNKFVITPHNYKLRPNNKPNLDYSG